MADYRTLNSGPTGCKVSFNDVINFFLGHLVIKIGILSENYCLACVVPVCDLKDNITDTK